MHNNYKIIPLWFKYFLKRFPVTYWAWFSSICNLKSVNLWAKSGTLVNIYRRQAWFLVFLCRILHLHLHLHHTTKRHTIQLELVRDQNKNLKYINRQKKSHPKEQPDHVRRDSRKPIRNYLQATRLLQYVYNLLFHVLYDTAGMAAASTK